MKEMEITRELIYQKLEHEFELTHDNHKYMKLFQTLDAEIAQISRFEKVLLERDLCSWVVNWEENAKKALKDYCERRYGETNNNHLKVKYGWGLWVIGGKYDYKILNTTISRILEILDSYINVDDYEHATTFCRYYKKVYPFCCKMGRDIDVIPMIKKVMASDNETLKFHVLAMIYHQEQEDELIKEKKKGYENKPQLRYLKKMDAYQLARACLKLASKETDDLRYERLIEWAVFYSKNTADEQLKKDAYEKLGDYKMTHLFPEQEWNMAIPHQNDILLRQAMLCFKEACNDEKLKQATLAYENNLSKKKYPRITHSISIEERNRQIELMNDYIKATLDKETLAIIRHLLAYGIDVFMPCWKETIMDNCENLYYQTMMAATVEDSFHNSRDTTHETIMTFQLADSFYKNNSFDIFVCIICSGLKTGKLSIEILKEVLIELGFDLMISKTGPDGQLIGTSYWERVDIGMRDFLNLIQNYADQESVDWRYCLTFLSAQFEGLIRDVITKLGGTTTRIKKETDTELIPLEGLLNSDCLRKVFTDEDIFMFKMAFTKDGYNIRNDIAHGMLLPQEYNAMRTLLVFVSIIRISKATSYIASMKGDDLA